VNAILVVLIMINSSVANKELIIVSACGVNFHDIWY